MKMKIFVAVMLLAGIANANMNFISQSRSVSASNDKGSSDSISAPDFGIFNQSASVSWNDYSATGQENSTLHPNKITASGYALEGGPWLAFEDFLQETFSSIQVVFEIKAPLRFLLDSSIFIFFDDEGFNMGWYETRLSLSEGSTTIISGDTYPGPGGGCLIDINECIILHPGVYTLRVSSTAGEMYYSCQSCNATGGGGQAGYELEFSVLGPQTFYVDANALNDPGTGIQSDPFKRIQDAIDFAIDGDKIVVLEGTYYENINISGKNITLTGTDPNDSNTVAATIIDGQQSGSVVMFQGNKDSNCLLTGFTITNGFGSEFVDSWGNNRFCGAGVRGNSTHASLRKCRIINNGSGDNGYGGGIYGFDGLISQCIIAGNYARIGAGLSFCQGDVTKCVIENNHGEKNLSGGTGEGLYSCNGTIQDCIIQNNGDKMLGGSAVAICNGKIINCTIQNNFGWDGGGGLFGCDAEIRNCKITGNYLVGIASGAGLSHCNGAIINCEISNNQTYEGNGGGLHGCDGFIANCIIMGNIVRQYDYSGCVN